MTNAVYNMIAQALAGSVSQRAAEKLLQATLQEHNLSPETVTAAEMQELLSGPLVSRLSSVLPPAKARAEAQTIARKVEKEYPRAPTLFTDVGSFATWDDTKVSPANPWHDAGLNADDFEFDDPEFGGKPVAQRLYALDNSSGQEDLIRDLGRMQGVMGVLISKANGEVLRMKALRDASALSSVIAAASLLFQKRQLRLLSVDLGTQTVCMRPLGAYCIAVITGPQVNVGRLLGELQQVEVAA